MILMIGRKKGDVIEGGKIFCQGRKIEKRSIIHKGRHRMQTASVESRGRESAFCQIERELVYNGFHKLDWA